MNSLVKPEWLKIRYQKNSKYEEIRNSLKSKKLNTVCVEAKCPNINECWGCGTVTVMIMGDTCTRTCRFCDVKTGSPGQPLDPLEPENTALALKNWDLDYVVITSVDRDELKDQGAGHFSKTIQECKKECPNMLVEVLVPDFRGEIDLIKTVLDAKPDVFAHNIETVERLQKTVRDLRANYKQSLSVLENAKKISPETFTKSSIMVGLGETKQEVAQTMKDLRTAEVDFLTLGQYLRPTEKHIEISEYVHPDTFKFYKEKGLELGFKYVASGPFVRSSYKAAEFFIKAAIKQTQIGYHDNN